VLSKESFWQSTYVIARQVAPVEGVQYALGIFGGIAAREHPWVLVGLVVPVLVVYFAFKALKETRPLKAQMMQLVRSQSPTRNSSSPDSGVSLFPDSSPAPTAEADFYAILQVAPKAAPDVINTAYRQLTRLYHPDLNPRTDAAVLMGSINQAYDVLGDPGLRTEYDRRKQEPSPGRVVDIDFALDSRLSSIAQLLEHELREGCRDNTVSIGVEAYARDWLSQVLLDSPELQTRAASIFAFLQGYSEMTTLKRTQVVLQALARARNQPIPIFRTGQPTTSSWIANSSRRIASPTEQIVGEGRPGWIQRITMQLLHGIKRPRF